MEKALNMEGLLDCEMVLVVGNSRSGTTMMSRILGRHSSVYSMNELHFFEHHIKPEQIRSKNDMVFDQAIHLLCRLLHAQRDGVFAPYSPETYLSEAAHILKTYGTPRGPAHLFQIYCFYEAKCHGKSIVCEQTPKNIYFVSKIS